ncbi:AbrB/MazE/SpoVT family DNA-binding domain-containing protein [Nanoarchaeota archaeon]
MKKYPKIVQCDSRGQIVIPKDIRRELNIDEGTGFWVYAVTDEGILLKKIDTPNLDPDSKEIQKLKLKSERLGMKESNVDETVKKYKKTKEGNLELV